MTTFSFGGTQLETLGRVTQINDYLDLPQARGGNQLVAYRHGTTFQRKYYDERTLSFGIAIVEASAAALETKFATMRTLFSPRHEQTLSITLENASVITAQASVDKSMQVNRLSDRHARVVVEFTLCEPFFRSDTAIADNTMTVNANPKAMTVTNPGTVEERDPTIIITGPFSTINISNLSNGASISYAGSIAALETVTIGTLNGEFYATLSTGSANVIGNVSHAGSTSLLPLNTGSNSLSITHTGGDGSGTVKVSFFAPYL